MDTTSPTPAGSILNWAAKRNSQLCRLKCKIAGWASYSIRCPITWLQAPKIPGGWMSWKMGPSQPSPHFLTSNGILTPAVSRAKFFFRCSGALSAKLSTPVRFGSPYRMPGSSSSTLIRSFRSLPGPITRF